MVKKLKIPLKQFGDVLVSRPSAQDAYRDFRDELSKHPFIPVRLDFSGVKVMAPSWLDEFMQLLRKDEHDVHYESPKRNTSVVQSIKTIEESAASTAEKHPWRLCGPGFHWVIRHPRQKKVGKLEDVDGHCRRNPSHKDTLYPDEISRIASERFSKFTRTLHPASPSYEKKGNYDTFIAGWTRYWNDVLKPREPLNPNLVKALIQTESGFARSPKKNDRRAIGLMQILPETAKILSNPCGELPDHTVSITLKDAENPNINIASGIRWLFWKKKLASIKLKREATWLEAVWEYKSIARKSKRNEEIKDKFLKAWKDYQ